MDQAGREGLELIRFLYRYRKWLAVIPLSCAALSVAMTFFITPRYSSSAIVFPPAFNSVDRMLENPQFGYNIEADRLIQVANSVFVKDSLFRCFDLAAYYSGKKKEENLAALYDRFKSDFNVERTKYMSVEITVTNSDPEMAALIANKAVDILADFWNRVFKKNLVENLEYAENQYLEKHGEVAALLDSMYSLRVFNAGQSAQGIRSQFQKKLKDIEDNLRALSSLRSQGDFFDYDHQMEIISEDIIRNNSIIEKEKSIMAEYEKNGNTSDTTYTLARARHDGAINHGKYLAERLASLRRFESSYALLNTSASRSMDEYYQMKSEYERLINSFDPYVAGVRLAYLEDRYEGEQLMLTDLKKRYENTLRLFNQPIPGIFIIERAMPAFRPVYPSRLLAGLVTLAASFFITALVFLFRERWPEISGT